MGVCHGELSSSPAMASALGVSLSLTVDKGLENRDVNPCQGQGGVHPIPIVVSDVPMMFNVVADRCDANRDRCVYTSFAFNVVSDEHRHLTRKICYCMMLMFNIVCDDQGYISSSPTVPRACRK